MTKLDLCNIHWKKSPKEYVTSCHGWDCLDSQQGYICPAGAPGAHPTTSYICNNKKWEVLNKSDSTVWNSTEWCNCMKKNYGVVPNYSWGSISNPNNPLQKKWLSLSSSNSCKVDGNLAQCIIPNYHHHISGASHCRGWDIGNWIQLPASELKERTPSNPNSNVTKMTPNLSGLFNRDGKCTLSEIKQYFMQQPSVIAFSLNIYDPANLNENTTFHKNANNNLQAWQLSNSTLPLPTLESLYGGGIGYYGKGRSCQRSVFIKLPTDINTLSDKYLCLALSYAKATREFLVNDKERYFVCPSDYRYMTPWQNNCNQDTWCYKRKDGTGEACNIDSKSNMYSGSRGHNAGFKTCNTNKTGGIENVVPVHNMLLLGKDCSFLFHIKQNFNDKRYLDGPGTYKRINPHNNDLWSNQSSIVQKCKQIYNISKNNNPLGKICGAKLQKKNNVDEKNNVEGMTNKNTEKCNTLDVTKTSFQEYEIYEKVNDVPESITSNEIKNKPTDLSVMSENSHAYAITDTRLTTKITCSDKNNLNKVEIATYTLINICQEIQASDTGKNLCKGLLLGCDYSTTSVTEFKHMYIALETSNLSTIKHSHLSKYLNPVGIPLTNLPNKNYTWASFTFDFSSVKLDLTSKHSSSHIMYHAKFMLSFTLLSSATNSDDRMIEQLEQTINKVDTMAVKVHNALAEAEEITYELDSEESNTIYGTVDSTTLDNYKSKYRGILQSIANIKNNSLSEQIDANAGAILNLVNIHTTLNIINNDINSITKTLKEVENNQHVQNRRSQIQKYYSDVEKDYAKVAIIMLYTCIPMLCLTVMKSYNILSPSFSYFLIAIVFFIGLYYFVVRIYDITARNNMEYDEYDFEILDGLVDNNGTNDSSNIFDYDKTQIKNLLNDSSDDNSASDSDSNQNSSSGSASASVSLPEELNTP